MAFGRNKRVGQIGRKGGRDKLNEGKERKRITVFAQSDTALN